MSEFMFGVSRTKPTRANAKKMDAIARSRGAYLVEATLPGTGYQRWFCADNRGYPFDDRLAKAVNEDIAAAGIR